MLHQDLPRADQINQTLHDSQINLISHQEDQTQEKKLAEENNKQMKMKDGRERE